MKLFKYGLLGLVVLVAGAIGLLSMVSGLKSDPAVGLSPLTHTFETVNVREYTSAPLRAEVKVFLPIQPRESIAIIADFSRYSDWVAPPPDNVTVDNSKADGGVFGVGSIVSYKDGEADEIVLFDPERAMIAKPLWGKSDFTNHRGVVIVTKTDGGSIVHMRRYFEIASPVGWMMSKLMPMFMADSAENLAQLNGGRVL